MFRKTLLLFFFTLDIFAFILHDTYHIDSTNIKLQTIVPHAKYDITLYKIDRNRHSKKIKTADLLAILLKHGFEPTQTKSRYVRFIQKSPVKTLKIENFILNAYKQKYSGIKIHSLRLTPRGYIKSIPLKYTIKMPKRFFLRNKGTLSIKTLQNKQIFFDYLIDANLWIYISRYKTQKGEKLSALNSTKKKIRLDKLKALPVNVKQLNTTQFKRRLKADTVITIRDIEALNLVKKGDQVLVTINDNNINISFSAKALQSGKLRDIITVQKSNKKRLKVQIIGKNKVKMQ